MKSGIRLIAQCYDIETGDLIEEEVLNDSNISKATNLKDLGYLHVEQIDFLQKIQDFKIKHQIILSPLNVCPSCRRKTKKTGKFKSNFHAVLTDHKVLVQRTTCKCGWSSPSSIEGMFGCSLHPDLLKKQALQGGKESYEKSSKSLNSESANNRSINSHSQIYKSVKCVGEKLESFKTSKKHVKNPEPASNLIVNIDGGHIKARGDSRSFEAMVATVYRPENLKYVDKNHNAIISKTAVASAKNDNQKVMKALFKNACKAEGMTEDTNIVCLADGAENCWSITHSIESSCGQLTFILDWFHIAMKFKNISIPRELHEKYDKVKWHLWRGNVDKALKRLEQLKSLINDVHVITKLNKLAIYIENNKKGIINYEVRKKRGLVFTSNLAESTVNTLINERQKGRKKMLWSREGAHNILQIRTSTFSNTWDNDWEKIESEIYRKAA